MPIEQVAGLIADSYNNWKTIDNISNKVNQGDVYCLNLSTTATAGSTVLLFIQTPNTTVRQNFIAQINSSIATITSYFGTGTVPTATGYSTLTAYNMNRNSTKATTTIFGVSATSSQFSTYGGTVYERYQAQMPAFVGTVLNGAAQYGWNLAQNTAYIIGVICPTTAAVQINAKLIEM